MKISVVMPVYNGEEHLRYAVESVLQQTYWDLELILVNDGSSDRTAELCDAFGAQDPRVRVVHQANAGVSAARNAGLALAEGEWVTFVDADDHLELDAYERVAQEIRRGVGLDLVIFGIVYDYHDGAGVTRSVSRATHDVFDIRAPIGRPFFQLYDNDYICSACNKVFRTDRVRTHSIAFVEDLGILEDLKFVLDFFLAAGTGLGVAVIGPPLYHYSIDERRFALAARPEQDYLKSFAGIESSLRAFAELHGLSEGEEAAIVDGIVVRIYLIGVERAFASAGGWRAGRVAVRALLADRRFTAAVGRSRVSGGRLRAARWLLKQRCERAVVLGFGLNATAHAWRVSRRPNLKRVSEFGPETV